jgi:hypothetical protein
MSGSELVPLYYLSGIALAVGGGVAGVRSYLGRQREKWLDEGKKEADLSKVLEDNSRVGTENTAAINNMLVEMRRVGTDLRDFTAESRRRFEDMDSRLDASGKRFQMIEDSIWGGRGTQPDRGLPGRPDQP